MITKLTQLGGDTPSVVSSFKNVSEEIRTKAKGEHKNIINFLRSKGINVSVEQAQDMLDDCIRYQQINNM